MRCVEDGIATPEEVDEVARSTFGFRLPFFGPFQIADMAGLDVYSAVMRQHRDGLGERFFVPDTDRGMSQGSPTDFGDRRHRRHDRFRGAAPRPVSRPETGWDLGDIRRLSHDCPG